MSLKIDVETSLQEIHMFLKEHKTFCNYSLRHLLVRINVQKDFHLWIKICFCEIGTRMTDPML